MDAFENTLLKELNEIKELEEMCDFLKNKSLLENDCVVINCQPARRYGLLIRKKTISREVLLQIVCLLIEQKREYVNRITGGE